MSTGEDTIAARVTRDFRRELEARRDELRAAGVHYPDGREVDLSYVIRVGLRAYLDGAVVNLRAVETRPGSGIFAAPGQLGALDAQPLARTNGTGTERAAARAAWPKANTQRRRIIGHLADVGDYGATADELNYVLGGIGEAGRAGTRRLTELKAGGWVEVKLDDAGVVTRQTRSGSQAQVHVLTAQAKAKLAEEAACS